MILLTLCLCLLLLPLLLSSCRGGGTGDETLPESTDTETPTERGTQPADTDEPTSPDTDAPDTQPVVTQPVTEADTEPAVDPNAFPVGSLSLCGRDISEFTVVVPADMTEVERLAANELCGLLSEACGARLRRTTDDAPAPAHAICLGRAVPASVSREGLGEEGWHLVTDENHLYITGEDGGRGTLYGVYAFLDEHVGCRFLSADVTYVVPAGRITLEAGMDETFVPQFEYRELAYYGTLEQPVFSTRLGMNGSLGRDLADVGGGVVFAHESYAGYRSYAYTFGHTIGILNGTTYEVGQQPCYSDEATYTRVLASVRRWLSANPQSHIISVTQTDGSATGCTCDACRAVNDAEGTPMGTMLLFVNRIAAAIRDEFPDARVLTYAYCETIVPPKTIVPEDNVIICLCSIACCTNCAYAECGCESCRAFLSYLDKWAEISRTLYIYDYMVDYHYLNLTVSNLHTIVDNMRLWTRHGAKGVFALGNLSSTDGEFCELRTYLESQLILHPDMTDEQYEARMDDFLRGWYGNGWEEIKAYILRMEEACDGQHIGCNAKPDELIPGLAENDELRAELVGYWTRAAAAAADQPEALAHVRKSSIQAEYLVLCTGFEREPDHEERARALYKLMRECGITHLRENTPFAKQFSFTRSPLLWLS